MGYRLLFDRLVCSRPYPYHFLPLFPRSRNLWKGSDTDCHFRSCRRMAGYYARATDSYQQLPKVFYIQTPYLLPTEPILMALKTAALAGVDVRIMIPARADTWITHLGSLSYLDDIMRAGVRIYLYQKGFLHSKLMVSDDTLSTVGSTNMDFRSFEHNFEVNAFMYDPSSALLLKGIFLQDQKDAILLQRKTWIKRPWYQKAQESIVRLLAPLL